MAAALRILVDVVRDQARARSNRLPAARSARLSVPEAINRLRADPAFAQLIHDPYLDHDALGCAERFAASAEFAEVCRLLEGQVQGAVILDLGAGTGIASFAFARAGANVRIPCT